MCDLRLRDLDAEWLGRRAIEGGDRTTLGDLVVRLMEALAVAILALQEIEKYRSGYDRTHHQDCQHPACMARRALDTVIGDAP